MTTSNSIQSTLPGPLAGVHSWLSAQPWSELELDASFAQTIRQKGTVQTCHLTRTFESAHLSWIRCSLIWNPQGTAIVNLAGFPRLASPLPALQAELVIVRGRLRLALVDLLALDRAKWPHAEVPSPSQACLDWGQNYAELGPVSDPPEWTKGVVSPQALWSRASTARALDEAWDSLSRFQDWWSTAERELQLAAIPPPLADLRRKALDHLRHQCLNANPSKGFLGATFGHDWADLFLKEVLYPPLLAQPTCPP